MCFNNADVTIGFNQTLYNVNENEPLAFTFVAILSGTLRREVTIEVSTQENTALGMTCSIMDLTSQ